MKQASPLQISTQNYTLKSVFDRYDVSPVSDASLAEICASRNLDADFLVEILRMFEGDGLPDPQLLQAFPLPVLVDYLQRTHEYYLSKRLPEIELGVYNLIMDPAKEAGFRKMLANFYTGYRKTLFEHIHEEEFTLFPYIRRLINAGRALPFDICDHIPAGYSIQQFIHQHDDAAEKELQEMKQVILNHRDASPTLSPYRVFINQIDAFEKDLIIHGFIEDEVMIPIALQLEAALQGK